MANKTNKTAAPKTLTLRTMTIQREGNLKIRIQPGAFHCGPVGEIVTEKGLSFMPATYSCRVVCAPKTDARGFLFDQAMLDKWLQWIAGDLTSLSCEKLCADYAEKFLAKLAKDRPECEVISLSLTLSPAPHKASITVEYGA